jgi:hypothetical protein
LGACSSADQTTEAETKEGAEAEVDEWASALAFREQLFDHTSLMPKSDTATNFFNRGDDILEKMNASEAPLNAYALGYLAGVKDTLGSIPPEIIIMVDEFGKAEKKPEAFQAGDAAAVAVTYKAIAAAKYPGEGEDTTLGKLQQVVKEYLDKNPELTDRPAALLVWAALVDMAEEETIGELSESGDK